jgi:amino acid efflux transporter
VGHLPRPSVNVFLGFIALTGLALIALSALQLADINVLVSIPTTMFLCVYLSCTLSATRLLTGETRIAAAVAVLAVAGVLAFSGWTALLAAVLVAAIAALIPDQRKRPSAGAAICGTPRRAATVAS